MIFDLKSDRQNNEEYINLSAITPDGNLNIGEMVFNTSLFAVKSELVNNKYFTIFRDTVKTHPVFASLEEMFEVIENDNTTEFNFDVFKFAEDDIKYLKNIYNETLKENINNSMLAMEKAEVKIGNDTKKCDKVTLTLASETIEKIVKDLADKCKNDEKVLDIIVDKLIEIYGLAVPLSDSEKQDLKQEYESSAKEYIDEIVDLIGNANINTIEISTYANSFETYQVSYEVLCEDFTITLDFKLDDNNLDINLSFEDTYYKQKAEFNINAKKTNDGASCIITAKVAGITAKLEINTKAVSENESETEIILTARQSIVQIAKLSLVEHNRIITDEADNYSEDGSIVIDAEFQGEKITGTINYVSDISIKDSVEIPEVTKENSEDIVQNGTLEDLMNSLEEYIYQIFGNM